MAGRSGFLKQFAEGFITAEVADRKTKKEAQQIEDAYRKKKLVDLDIDSQLEERKLTKKAELDAADRKARLEQSAADFGSMFSGGSAEPTPKSAFEMGQLWTAKAAAFEGQGLKEEANAAKLKADYYQQQVSQDEKTRNVKREPPLTAEGISGSKAFSEREQKRLLTGGTSLYLPEDKRVAPGLGSVQADYELEKQSSAKAQQLYSAIEQTTANEAGKSALSDTTIEVLTQKAVKLNNSMAAATDPTQKEKLTEEYVKLLMEADSMKQGLSDTIRTTLGDSETVPAESVPLSTDAPTEQKTPQQMASDPAALEVQAQYKANKLTREQAIQKLQGLGYSF